MKCMVIGWAIGTAVALALCWTLLPRDSVIIGMIVGGIFSLLGLWLGAEWDLRRVTNGD